PLPNILVFVQDPNSPVPVFSQGVTVPNGSQTGCSAQPLLVPATVLGSALTDPTGTFTFNVAGMLPPTLNIVIQAGKWRRQYQYTSAQIASFTIGTQVTLPTMSMPSSQSEGDLPHIAVVTGSADEIECIFPQIGIKTAEVTDPLGGGSINFFTGNGSAGENVSPSTPTETQLVNPAAAGAVPMTNYDMVIFGCQGPSGRTDSDAPAYASTVVKYANDGGRVFATHWEFSWIQSAPEWSPLASFSSSTSTASVTTTGQLSTSYSGEPTLAAWMNAIGAFDVNPAQEEFKLTAVFYENILAVNPPAQTWVTLPNYNGSSNQFSFDTPVGATGVPTAVLSFTNNQTSYLLGDTNDSIDIKVTDNSSSPTSTGLTLTLSIPSGVNTVSLADVSGGFWQCTVSGVIGHCTLPAVLAPGASDTVRLTFAIPQTATLGPTTLIGTLAGGGLNQSQQCGRVLYNDYHVENGGAKAAFNNGARCTNTGSLTAAQKFLEFSLYNLSNFISPTTSDTIDIQSMSTTQITTNGQPGVMTPIYYGQAIGDTNGANAIVSTSAPPGPDNGSLLVYVDTTLACTLPNNSASSKCSDTLFTGQDAGAHTVYATFTGDVDYASSVSPNYSVQILPDDTTIAAAGSGSPSILGTAVIFTATVAAPYATPSGPVTFTIDGVVAGTGTLSSSGVASFSTSTLAVGTHSVVASYAATLDFNGSVAAMIAQVVTYPPAPTVTTLTSSINPSYFNQNVTFTATVVATAPLAGPLVGTVTFYDGTNAIGTSTISGLGVATISTSTLAVGVHNMTAVFTPATPLPTSITSTSANLSQVVNPNTFTLAVDPTSFALIIGSSVSVNVTVTDVGGFYEPVKLSCSGPASTVEMACAFGELMVPAGGGSTRLTFTPAAPHPCATVASAGPDSRVDCLGFGLAAVLLFLTRKRRCLIRGLTLGLALCLLPLLNGCGTSGCTDFGVKPGTYVVTVTGTSAAPNAFTQSQNVTITVNP
ncbi:MAG: Ig-like domain-containing protein, partial [Acidobacteriota bacterium]